MPFDAELWFLLHLARDWVRAEAKMDINQAVQFARPDARVPREWFQVTCLTPEEAKLAFAEVNGPKEVYINRLKRGK